MLLFNNKDIMDKRISTKSETYRSEFMTKIKETASNLGLDQDERGMQLLQFILDYERLTFNKEDLQKRKRIKNHVPAYDRCCAKRANDEQCTRRKKEGFEYCGTHVKGTPHGIISVEDTEVKPNIKKIDVWTQDIKGIIYYIDNNNNVYETTDIIQNKINPQIIAKYVKNGDNYSIPEFNI